MKAHWQYLKYVLRHKWYVFWACLEMGVPIWIALFHDWDKFLPDEWNPYVHTFYAPDGTKQYKESVDFARAWMLHQHRNKHHWQYWLIIGIPSHNTAIPLPKTDYLMWDRGELQRVVKQTIGTPHGAAVYYELQPPFPSDYFGGANEMPDVYRREMIADWIGAGKALGFPDTLAWYVKNREKMKLHSDTRKWVEHELGYDKLPQSTAYVEPTTGQLFQLYPDIDPLAVKVSQ